MASTPVPMPLSTNSPSSLPNSLDPPTPTTYDYQLLDSTKSDTLPSFLLSLQQSEAVQQHELPVRMPAPGPGLQHARRKSKARQGPPPLPNFTFNPGAETKPDPTPSPTHPILEEMASKTRNTRGGRPALPAFSFNPGGAGDTPPSASPTKLAFVETKAGGHHRRESGYAVGDMASMTSSSSCSSSPVKTEGHLSGGPPVSGLSSAGRRHTHRRSEAVSISDQEKSAIIKENALSKHRAGSAPSTPADGKPFFDNDNSDPMPATTFSAFAGRTPPTSPSRQQSTPVQARPRVEFSDSVQTYRPRPLSHISSETEDSTSTVRQSHSLSGSINSLAAISPATTSISPGPTFDGSPRNRPRTADAAAARERSSDKKDDESPPRALFHHSSTKSLTPLKLNWPSEEQRKVGSCNSGPNAGSPKTASSNHGASPMPEPGNSFSFTPAEEPPRPRTSPERSASIKRRKVKNWTGGIFSRKTKRRPMKNIGRRTPTSPSNRRIPDSVFDNDNTVVIHDNPSPDEEKADCPPLQTIRTPVAPSFVDQSEDRDKGATIDIDAALGSSECEEQQPQTGFAAARARLHSGGMRSAIDQFGNLHRRAESAPHLPFPNRNIFGVHRIGSNSSMGVEEVFDEEEEDDYLAGSGSEVPPSPSISGTMSAGNATSAETNAMETREQVNQSGAKIEEIPEMALLPHQSSGSNLRPTNVLDLIGTRPASLPMDFAFKSSSMPYVNRTEDESAPQSAVSSDAGHSGFDAQIGSSRFLVEPHYDGQTVSTDDIPSLTDSISTATGAQARVSGSVCTRPSMDQREQRSFSESAPPTDNFIRTYKRASLVSLTRLIPGSSHGEKSKLRFGESAPNIESEAARPAKKANRISRLIHYLRPKDKPGK